MTANLTLAQRGETWAFNVEIVIFGIFAWRCLRRPGRDAEWLSLRLYVAIVAAVPFLVAAWLNLDELSQLTADDLGNLWVKHRIVRIRDLIKSAFVFTLIMTGLHTALWLFRRKPRHKPTISDNLNPIAQ